MRVIAGSARRLLLMTPPGTNTRPTTDRIKETLFNMLQPHLGGCRFLDLFAGSGGIGIEALSRGAGSACFADNSADAIRCIKANLEHTHLADRATVYATDYLTAISRMKSDRKKFDVVFLDPPYGRGMEEKALAAMTRDQLLAEDALVVIETAIDEELPDLSALGYRLSSIKEYKSNRHLFVKPLGGEESTGQE